MNEAATGKITSGPLAIYVSLRDLESPPDSITASALREYIERQANPRESTELARYLKDQFENEISSGNLVILLDSFDEIPSILGAANIDKSVLPYVEAINALVGGGPAKCIVASREYKGPRVPGWTRLYLIGMSYEEQIKLLKSYGVPANMVPLLKPLLLDPRAGFSTDLRNPLYLSLLAQFVIEHGRPPTRPTEMFEDYIFKQIGGEELSDIQILLCSLESFAKELTSDNSSGLSAEASVLRRHIREADPGISEEDTEALADKLASSKLLIDIPATARKPRRVAFVHRRVQEYFTTRYVIRHPNEIPPRDLAAGARWRETAVAMLQVGTQSDTALLCAELDEMLRLELEEARSKESQGIHFTWAQTAVHVLELLVSAFGSDFRGLPASLRVSTSSLIEIGWEGGLIDDRKLALDCIPIIEPEIRQRLATSAFAGSSVWLRLSALRDCSSLHPLPDTLNDAIRRLLITLMDSAQLRYDGPGIDSDLSRLYNGNIFRRARKLLASAPFMLVSLLLACLVTNFLIGVSRISSVYDIRFEIIYVVLLPLAWFWAIQSSTPMSYVAPASRIRRFFLGFLRIMFGRRQTRGTPETDDIWITINFTASILLVLYLVIIGVLFANDHIRSGMLNIVGAILFIYSFLWGPALLLAVRMGTDGSELRTLRIAILPLQAFSGFIREYGRVLHRILYYTIIGIIPVAIFIAAVDGILYLLEHFAGHVGRDVSDGISIAFLYIVPIGIVVLLVRNYLSRRRVRRSVAASSGFGPEVFLNNLRELADPTEAAEYIRLLRVRYPDRTKQLPLELVRELAATIEKADPNNSLSTAWSEEVRALVMERSNSNEWATGVLDEIGRLAEFLRDR